MKACELSAGERGGHDPKLSGWWTSTLVKAPLIPLWSKRVRQGGGAGEAARGFVNMDKGPGAWALSQLPSPGPSALACSRS